MGSVIRIDNQNDPTRSVLTETGEGGLFSAGYLREKPARSYLEGDERPVFVLTNQKRGIERSRDGDAEQITPGPGYRTIAVLSDRRVVVLVGDAGSSAGSGGDLCLTVPLVDVESVTTDGGRRDGSLTVTQADGQTLTVHCGTGGLDDAAAYLTAASQAWIHVENVLDDVKRSLVAATGRLDDGEYDDALAVAREAYHRLNDPRRTANEFDDEWSESALTARVDAVQSRCVRTLAEVRLRRARRFTDRAERHWRDDEFETAHDAYERAQEEYETILTYDSGSVENREDVHAEAERVDRVVAQLEEAPLRRAVEADRAASDADDPVTAAEEWEDAMDHYRTAMELDWGADERRFAGDPDQIRDRLGVVVERLVSARREAATEAKRAGDWYVGAEQFDVAIEEFETARDQYDRALDVARERYPDATEHLSVERDAVEERIERAKAARDGDPVEPVETNAPADDEPTYDVEATIGTDAPVDGKRSTTDGGTTANDGTGDDADESETGEGTVDDVAAGTGDDASGAEDDDGTEATARIESRLRHMDEAAFTDVVVTVLSETGWTPSLASVADDYDVEATKESPAGERLVVRVRHRPDDGVVTESTIADCATLRDEEPDVDAVMVATSGGVTSEATRRARREQVRVLDDEYLSTVIESRDMTDLLASRRVAIDSL